VAVLLTEVGVYVRCMRLALHGGRGRRAGDAQKITVASTGGFD